MLGPGASPGNGWAGARPVGSAAGVIRRRGRMSEAPAEFQVYKTRASVRRPPRMRLQKNRADFGRLCTAAGGDSRGRKMPVIPRITELACVELARRHGSPIRSAG